MPIGDATVRRKNDDATVNKDFFGQTENFNNKDRVVRPFLDKKVK